MSKPVIRPGDRVVIHCINYPPRAEHGKVGTYVKWQWKDVEEILFDDGTTGLWAGECIRLLDYEYEEEVTKFKAGDRVRTLQRYSGFEVGDIARIHYVGRYRSTDIPNYSLIGEGEDTPRHGGWGDEDLELVE